MDANIQPWVNSIGLLILGIINAWVLLRGNKDTAASRLIEGLTKRLEQVEKRATDLEKDLHDVRGQSIVYREEALTEKERAHHLEKDNQRLREELGKKTDAKHDVDDQLHTLGLKYEHDMGEARLETERVMGRLKLEHEQEKIRWSDQIAHHERELERLNKCGVDQQTTIDELMTKVRELEETVAVLRKFIEDHGLSLPLVVPMVEG